MQDVISFQSEQQTVPSITSVSQLQEYAKGTIVQLPPFADGQPLVARVRRPSILKLASQGKIPNSLLSSANTMFTKGAGQLDTDDEDMLKDMYDIAVVMTKACLLEPSFEQIESAGLELTDEQLMAIFSFSQRGNAALEQFRQE
jgi:hypothetical protein